MSSISDVIKAKFVMISGSEDKQTSADVHNVGSFQLPHTAGKAGGACTASLLKVLNEHSGPRLSWLDLLHKMRDVLRQKGFDQVPQLSASEILNSGDPFYICPPDNYGTKRAILIGINYVGQQGQLSGCHNDVNNIKHYLINKEGFQEKDMLILMDDGQHHSPTRRNIEDAFTRITQYSKEGDIVFIHYSGHGGRVRDTSGDEDDGYDETLIPVDFKSAGQILDDDVYKLVVKPMASGVNCTVLMDCCHSGTAMDLPYIMSATDTQMHSNDSFNLDALLASPDALLCAACLACCVLDDLCDIVGGVLGSVMDGGD